MADGSTKSKGDIPTLSRKEPGTRVAQPLRFAMPSVANVIFLALLGTLVFTPLSVRLLGDAGIGWHIRTGQMIAATHAVPRVDPFSSTMGGSSWYAWEWLYDLVVGQLEATLGLNGVVWLTAVLIAGVFARLFRVLIVRGANVVVAVLVTLLAIGSSMIHFLARPHVVSWVFTLAWFLILDRYERAESDARRLWLLPALMLVWVNVHGGFLVGFVLLGIFWVSAVWGWFTKREDRIEEVVGKIAAGKRAWNLLWVGLASVVASLVNPYGWKLHAHILSYLSNRFLMDHIDEFQSPNFHGVAPKCFLVMVLAAVVAVARKIPTSGAKSAPEMGHPDVVSVSELLIVLFSIYAGLYASRNIPVSAVLLAIVVGPRLWGGARSGFVGRMTEIESGLRGQLWPAVGVVATFLIAANGGRVGANRLMDAHFDATRMPVSAVNYLAVHEIAGPVMGPDSWGGYLIYRLYPKTHVVVDDRHDLYGAEFFKSYLKTVRVERGWEDFLHEHPASCLLLPRDGALANVLIESSEWKVVYTDDVAIAFLPSSARAATNR